MLVKKRIIGVLVIALATVMIAGCGAKATADPNQKMTEIAATVKAELTRAASAIPTTTPTPVPTETPTPGPESPTPEAASPTPTMGQVLTLPPDSITDNSLFIADVTYPDGTVVKPGEQFVKTWRFQNSGATTWTKDYGIVYLEGDLLGKNNEYLVMLGKDVAPGEYTEVSITFVAPTVAGPHTSYWKMYSAAGYAFGEYASISIVVSDITLTPTLVPPTPTITGTLPTATATFGPSPTPVTPSPTVTPSTATP